MSRVNTISLPMTAAGTSGRCVFSDDVFLDGVDPSDTS